MAKYIATLNRDTLHHDKGTKFQVHERDWDDTVLLFPYNGGACQFHFDKTDSTYLERFTVEKNIHAYREMICSCGSQKWYFSDKQYYEPYCDDHNGKTRIEVYAECYKCGESRLLYRTEASR